MTLDAKLRWKARIKKKREEMGLRYKEMFVFADRKGLLTVPS